MPTNLQIFNKGDLDVIFNPRVSPKRADVGIVASNGEDISNLFEPTNGSDQINFDTGYLTSRTDIRYLFQRKGYFPQYFLSVSDVVVNEGGTITCIIDVTDVPEGTQVCYYTSSDSDFVVPTGTVTIQGATATFSLTLKADQLTEGLETVSIYLKDCVKNTVLVTSDLITIRDTSRTPPTYSISTTSTEVNEGGSVTYSIVTTDVDDQTILFYTTSSNTDFDNPTGSVSVFSGKASLTLNVKNDLTTEGSETFRVFLKTDGLTGTTVATSSDVTIKDTSRTPPTYIITPDKTSAREGERVTFTVRTTDVDNGTVLYYVASLLDDVTPSTGAITIQSGTAVFTLTVKEDMLVEASESFTVALKTDSINGTTVRTSTSVAITTDCFKGSTKLSEITTNPTSLTPVSFGNFGAGRYVIEYVSGAHSFWDAGDNWLTGTFLLQSGTKSKYIGDGAVYTSSIVESKGREWNTNNFNVFEHTGGDITLTINDSPVTDNRIHPSYGAPKYAIYDYTCGNPPLYTIRADKTVVSEGDAIIVTVDTTGIQNGTILYYNTSSDADFNNPTGQVTVNNNTAQFTINVKKDLIYETTETFVINLLRGSIQGVVAATSSSITITPSQPTYSIASNRASVVEGSSIIFTVTTTDVQNGTILYYSTSSDADFDNPTGQVTINNNTAQFTLNAKKDLVFEGTELFTVTVKTGSQAGTVVCTTGSITLIDAQPTYTITANKASVVEGGSVIFTVTTTDVQNGTILYYSTSSDADFDVYTGQVTINNNTAQFTLNAKKDLVFEGSELFTVNLKTGSQSGTVVCTSGSVTIIDANPTYTITANKSSVVEGGSVIFTVTTTDVQNGTILYYSTSSDADFIAPTGQITINSDTAQFTLNVKADLNFEGSELFTVNLKTGSQSGTIVRTSESISITDATATYKIDPTPITTTSVSEGGSITFTVTTTDVQNGTIAYYYTSSDSDFINPTGQVTINNNTAQFTLNVKNDLATEGSEQFIASLKSATNVILCNSTSITIRDTSTTPPTYKIEPNKVVISEGDTIKFTVSTTEIPNGTKLYLKTTSDSDFNSYSNEVTVNNNTAELNLTVKNDIETEGDEYFNVSVSLVSVTGTVVCTSASVQIRDTSRTPIYAITANKASVDEGDVVTFAITTQNVVDGTVLYYEVDFNLNVGTNAGDFTGTTTGSVTTLGGKASFDITAKADLITEGTETFLARIRTNSNIGSVVATSPVVTINDTSKTPPTYSITSNTFSVNEGETIAFSITTTNVGNGTVLYYDIVNTTTNAGDFTGVTSGSVSILNNSASFSINIKADLTTEGSETFKARLLTGSSAGSVVATSASISISDTSTSLPTYSIVPNSNIVYEGESVTFDITTTNVSNNTELRYDIPGGANLITSTTDINICIDNTSLDDLTKNTIRDMVNVGVLKRMLLPFYNNDVTLYESRVKIFDVKGPTRDERTFGVNYLNRPKRTGDRVVNIAFQDETDNNDNQEAYNNKNNAYYNADVPALKQSITNNPGAFYGIVFQVEGYGLFKTFLQQVFAGTGVFTTVNLKNVSQIIPVYDVPVKANQLFYATKIIDAFRTLGILNANQFDASDLNITSGSVLVQNNKASFNVTATSDLLPEIDESFVANLRTTNNVIVNTSSSVTIKNSRCYKGSKVGGVVTTPKSSTAATFGSSSYSKGRYIIEYVSGAFSFWPSGDVWAINSLKVVTGDVASVVSNPIEIGFLSHDEVIGTSGNIEDVGKNWFGQDQPYYKVIDHPGGYLGLAISDNPINDNRVHPNGACKYALYEYICGTPTYTVSVPTSVDEGTSFTFTVNTTNVPNDTVLYFEGVSKLPSGRVGSTVGVFNNDVLGPGQTSSVTPNGQVTVRNSQASGTLNVRADSLTEGEEEFYIIFRTSHQNGPEVLRSSVIKINDTSTAPTYSIQPNVSEINEGGSVTFNIATSNVANGTQLSYALSRTDITPNTGTVTINNNQASFAVTANNDSTTEGYTTFTASLKSGSTTLATSNSVGINDTSTTPLVRGTIQGEIYSYQANSRTTYIDIIYTTTNVIKLELDVVETYVENRNFRTRTVRKQVPLNIPNKSRSDLQPNYSRFLFMDHFDYSNMSNYTFYITDQLGTITFVRSKSKGAFSN